MDQFQNGPEKRLIVWRLATNINFSLTIIEMFGKNLRLSQIYFMNMSLNFNSSDWKKKRKDFTCV